MEDELFQFGRTMEREPKLREALTDPGLPAEQKKAVLAELLGSKASPHTVSLIGFIVELGRAKDLSRIVQAVAEGAAERRRKAVGEARTANPPDAKQPDRL